MARVAAGGFGDAFAVGEAMEDMQSTGGWGGGRVVCHHGSCDAAIGEHWLQLSRRRGPS